MDDVDVLVIGGGPAGFVAAQVVSMLGGKVRLVEKERVGGICPNWGCIPMCFMDHCAEVIRTVKKAGNYGINTGEARIDYAKLMSEKDKVVQGVVAGMDARLQATGVPVVTGSAKLASPNQVEITFDNGKTETVRAEKIIIATGSTARRYDIPGAYSPGVLTTKELLGLDDLPKSLAIIGRSVTALELATVWGHLGSEVSLIARRPQLLPNEDEEIGAFLHKNLEEEGVHVYAGVDIEGIDDSEGGKAVLISDGGGKKKVAAQFVVFALGQQPLVEGLGLENAGVAATAEGIKTNEKMETSVKGIYATGDVTGEMMLASVAMVQGRIAGQNAMGDNAAIDYRLVPRSVRTIPQVATVGITEGEAKARGLDIKVGRVPLATNPKSTIIGEGEGFIKIIIEAASGGILGVHIVGPQASELIHEAVILMKMGGTVRDIIATIHGHPCLIETMQRAAMSMMGT